MLVYLLARMGKALRGIMQAKVEEFGMVKFEGTWSERKKSAAAWSRKTLYFLHVYMVWGKEVVQRVRLFWCLLPGPEFVPLLLLGIKYFLALLSCGSHMVHKLAALVHCAFGQMSLKWFRWLGSSIIEGVDGGG